MSPTATAPAEEFQPTLPSSLSAALSSSRHLSSTTSSWYDVTGAVKDVCTGDVFSVCGMNSLVNTQTAPEQETRATANDCECYENPQLSDVCKQSIKDMALWVE